MVSLQLLRTKEIKDTPQWPETQGAGLRGKRAKGVRDVLSCRGLGKAQRIKGPISTTKGSLGSLLLFGYLFALHLRQIKFLSGPNGRFRSKIITLAKLIYTCSIVTGNGKQGISRLHRNHLARTIGRTSLT